MDFCDSLRATLLYFDLFEYPLTETELFMFMPEYIDFSTFKARIGKAGLTSSDGLYHLRPGFDLPLIRRTRERRAKWMLTASSVVGKVIRCFPFVRGAFLSGSLSKGVDDGNADIDLFIVSAEHRLWICKSILTLIKKSFLLNKKKFLCPNYFVTEEHLEIPEKNIFTATELITLRPLYNEAMLERLIGANGWIREFYPNYKLEHSYRPIHNPFVQKALELPMSDGYSARLDERIMNYYKRVWKRRYPDYSEHEREFLFRTTPFASKVHPNDYQSKIIGAYERRLCNEGLTRLTRLNG